VNLILEITSPQPTVGSASRHTFHEEGGTIGREKDNSWVLPHTRVSSRHAAISYRDGVFYIEDAKSTNGVRLNSNRLERERPYRLESGDRILIDPYEIHVSITRERNDAAVERNVGAPAGGRRPDGRNDVPNPFEVDDPFESRPIPSSGLDTPLEEVPGQPLDPLEALGLAPKLGPPRKAPSAADLERGSLEEWHYQPPPAASALAPAMQADATAIPRDYNPLAPDDAPPAAPFPASAPIPASAPLPQSPRLPASPLPATPPSSVPTPAIMQPPSKPVAISPAAAVASSSAAALSPPHSDGAAHRMEDESDPSCAVDFAKVLVGAGLNPASVTPEVARVFGQILRVVVSGVMDVMRSRQHVKDEFRVPITRVRPVENNPLKFSANVDDALHNLLVKRNPAYLAPVEAFEDAFADLRHHQIAMLAGMRAAFESMLAEFDPDRLQEAFDRQLNKGLVPAKLRYWDLFREMRLDMVKDPDASFRRLFGEEFARAYEDQLRELKAQERNARKAPLAPKQRE
jgi:type VI secretion system FHA domain protein